MNPLGAVLALLVLTTVAYAGSASYGSRINSQIGTSMGTGTGIGAGTSAGTGTGTGKGTKSNPENGFMRGIGRSVSALYPSNWLQSVVQNVPSVDSISFRSLMSLPVNSASALLKTVFQHSHLNPFAGSLYTPNMSQMKMYLITANNNISVPMNNPDKLKNYPELSTGEVTILITGLPSNSEDPSDAVTELVEAYRARYQLSENQNQYTNSWDAPSTGNLIVIELGNSYNSFKKWATFDIEEAGKAIGQAIVSVSEYVPYYNIHLVGHNVGAHVAGAAARYYSQVKGNQLRRVTGLDPSKIYTKQQHIESELNRGVADFVDVIHSTSYGAGTETNGDVDFYPNGPGSVAPGSDNIIDASFKAVRYYAESVRPGNERNFMAVECNSLNDYENHRCHGIRIPMGYSTPYDVKGDFILRVNSNAPYGRNARNMRNNRNRSSKY